VHAPAEADVMLNGRTNSHASRRRFALSPAEEVFLAETPSTPATMQFELRVSGSLDLARVRSAVAVAVSKHPMTQVELAAQRFLFRPPQWEICAEPKLDDVVQATRCDDDHELRRVRDEFFSRSIPLDSAPALRALLVQRTGGDTLMLSIHHALMDGMGSLRWINSVARAYAGLPDSASTIDPISARDLKRQFGSNIPKDAVVVEPRGSGGRRWARIAGEDRPGRSGYGICHASLSAEICESLDPCGYGQDATFNDLLIAALHATIAAWNAAKGAACDYISILMPINLRPPAWNSEVAANLVLIARSITTAAERHTPKSLMQAITRETTLLRRGYLKLLTRSTLTCWLVANVLVPVMLNWPRVVGLFFKHNPDTTLFATLGRLERKVAGFGPDAGQITEIWISPPITVPLGLAMDSTILRGQLFISLRYCQTRFDSAAARSFCDLYLSTLQNLGRPAR
jgi:NRPS condensation-like uncharacterized protein